MEVTGQFRLIACLTVTMLFSCCWAAEMELYPLHPTFPRHQMKEIKFETIYKTVQKTTFETFTEYATCTSATSDIPPCMNMKVARTQRSLFSVTAKRHSNLQIILPLYATQKYQLHEDNQVISDGPVNRDLLESSLLSEVELVNKYPGQVLNKVQDSHSTAVLTPDLRLIIVRLTTTETYHSVVLKTNTYTTVGITYNGCVPADAPITTVCPGVL